MENRFDQLKTDPIFILGAARSGTTWVFDIFNAHPNVAGVFESWLFTRDNGVGSWFTPAHWPAKSSGLGRFLEREQVTTLSREVVQRMMSQAVGPNHQFIVEKSPSHLYAIPLIEEIFPQARFIHVLRDGRDVCVSVRAATRSWMPDWKRTFGSSIAASAKSWHDAVRRASNEGKRLGDRFLEVRYEELRTDPMPNYRKMFDFCGIPYDDSILQAVYAKTDFNLNFKGGEENFRRGGRIGDWRSHFTLLDTYNFQKTAGELLQKKGYVDHPRWWWQHWLQRPDVS